ncbi:MAG: hypothetical protein KAX49_12690 [Halanaerobiales bacterium]|nr:hypothetical protein [Halanaerobiales bacterium]
MVDPQVVYALVEESFKIGEKEVYIGDASSQKGGNLKIYHDLGYLLIFPHFYFG